LGPRATDQIREGAKGTMIYRRTQLSLEMPVMQISKPEISSLSFPEKHVIESIWRRFFFFHIIIFRNFDGIPLAGM
jgi:hypothetical protein